MGVPLLRSEPEGGGRRQVTSPFSEGITAHLEFSHGVTNLVLLPDIVDQCCDFIFLMCCSVFMQHSRDGHCRAKRQVKGGL